MVSKHTVRCACGAESDDHGYFVSEKYNTVDIDVSCRFGDVFDDGMCVEGETTTIEFDMCLDCWTKLQTFLTDSLGFDPKVKTITSI